MSKFIIEGPTKLSGEIDVKGAKNSALKIIPTAILSTEPIRINNLPNILHSYPHVSVPYPPVYSPRRTRCG